MTRQERFWEKVAKTDGCWLWTASTTPAGYGQFALDGKRPMRAHRVAWIYTKGAIPDGMCLLHSCDNPLCVNPDHMFLGSQKENMMDKVAKNRQRKGEGVPNSKLTEAAVVAIRKEFGRIPSVALARKFGVTLTSIKNAATGKTWRHVP